MLDLAIKHKEELQKKLVDTWFTDKYKFVHANVYCDEEKLKKIHGINISLFHLITKIM